GGRVGTRAVGRCEPWGPARWPPALAPLTSGPGSLRPAESIIAAGESSMTVLQDFMIARESSVTSGESWMTSQRFGATGPGAGPSPSPVHRRADGGQISVFPPGV